MSHRGEMIEDLSQVPRIALLQAVRNYDPDRGAQFTSYAVPAILGALKRHLRDRGWLVRPPCRLQAAYLSVSTALEDLGGGRDPTVTELAEHSRLAEHVVVETFSARAGRRATPLDAWLLRPDDAPWHESVSDHGAALATVDDRLLVAQLVGLLRSLSGTS
jgi:RNA polymerase sigma-B factor